MALTFHLERSRNPFLERAEQLSLEALDNDVEDARDHRAEAMIDIDDPNHDARMAPINTKYHRAVAEAHAAHEARLDRFRRSVLKEDPRDPYGKPIPENPAHLDHARDWLAHFHAEIMGVTNQPKVTTVDREAWYRSDGVRAQYLDKLAREAAIADGLVLAF